MIEYTQLKNHERKNLIEVIPLDKPFTMLIEPSNYCNFRCVSCFQSLKGDNYISRNRGTMSMDMYDKIISQLKDWNGCRLKVLKLSLYGEPFMNPHFSEMLRKAKEADVAERIETTTNASLLTESLCEDLVKYEIDYIRVSIYGGNQRRYEEVTGCSNANMEAILRSLKKIQEIKDKIGVERPFVSAKMLDTYGPENDEFLERFSEAADEVYIDKPHNWIATEEKSFIGSLYNQEQQEKLREDAAQFSSGRIACTMPFTTLAVRSNGDVSPCCIDWIGGTNLGNLENETLQEIWNGDKMYAFRKMQLENRKQENESCRNCEFYRNDYYIRDNIDGFPVERLRNPRTGVN